MSNEGQSPQGLAEQVDALVGSEPVVIFTDLGTGSCALTAQLTCRGNSQRAVVFGMNLPMLLDFVFHRALPLSELVPRLLEKGKEGVKTAGTQSGPSAESSTESSTGRSTEPPA
jgi:mannose/fructose-specific phosphotransferase system component IIA